MLFLYKYTYINYKKMPELPEVESIRVGLEKVLIGNIILRVEILEDKIISGAGNKRFSSQIKNTEFTENVINKKIVKIERRAKNIIIIFEDNSLIIIHLKMTGQIIFGGGSEAAAKDYTKINIKENKHTHLIFKLKVGTLYYNDIRKFGYVLYYKNIEEAVKAKHFSSLGMEPFDKIFTIKYFTTEIAKKNKNIKTVLLEQTIVVGCGNIYADEICFASKILPNRICKTLSKEEISNLYKNIKKILHLATKMKGSSISDYLLSDGTKGGYAKLHKVYGKHNTSCQICKNILQKIIISGRSSVYCSICQK